MATYPISKFIDDRFPMIKYDPVADKPDTVSGFLDESVVKNNQSSMVIEPKRWHQVWPFDIVVVKRNSSSDPTFYTYTLPIPPEAITINPIIASEATATLGGVVEETSQNVFWGISLQGTTGIVSKRKSFVTPPNEFRDSTGRLGMVSGALQQLGQFVAMGEDIVDAMSNIASDPLSALGSLTEAKQWFSESSVNEEWNGYAEILLIHKFLNAYSHAKENEPDKWELYFVHHKMNLMWRVVLKEFRILQSKERPYLYQYTMAFKGWDASDPNSNKYKAQKESIDRFKTDLKTANAFNLVNTLKKIRKTIKSVRRFCVRASTELGGIGNVVGKIGR